MERSKYHWGLTKYGSVRNLRQHGHLVCIIFFIFLRITRPYFIEDLCIYFIEYRLVAA